jgi:hypothetical protein
VNAHLRIHLGEAADQAVDLAAELTGPGAWRTATTVQAAVHLTYLAGLVRGVLDQLEDVGEEREMIRPATVWDLLNAARATREAWSNHVWDMPGIPDFHEAMNELARVLDQREDTP